MPDYTGNSNKDKETGASVQKGKPKTEKVIVTDVVIKKKSLGRRFRDLFIEADFKTAGRGVFLDVMVPAAKNMLYDAVTGGAARVIYNRSVGGQSRQMGSRATYTPYDTGPQRSGFGGNPMRHAPMTSPDPRVHTPRLRQNEFIISNKEEAEQVLESMKDIVDQYEIASVADLNQAVGLPFSPVDTKWGWTNLSGTAITQIREGFLINFPPPEPIS